MEKILIADDDPALRNLLRLVARRAGFEVDLASNGAEALKMLEETDYLLAVLDLMMPVMNGYEVVERLRERRERPGVIVVTATTDAFVRGLDGNVVQSIVRKPFDVELLGGVLTELAAAMRKERKADNVVDFPRDAAC